MNEETHKQMGLPEATTVLDRRRQRLMQRTGSRPAASWIVTYSDMITLLMAFFIGLIAFYARGPGSVSRTAKDAAVKKNRSWGHKSTVWRLPISAADDSVSSSKEDFLYQGPSEEEAIAILRDLTTGPAGVVARRHAVRLPLALLFDQHKRLTSSGMHLLSAIAAGARALPCDLQFHVEKEESLAQAVEACSYLMLQEGLLPARLAVGAHPPAEGAGEALWLVLVRHF